jgi:hypothetical protein
MNDVTVADLVLPGRRIDVPLERVGLAKCKCQQQQPRPAAELLASSKDTPAKN